MMPKPDQSAVSARMKIAHVISSLDPAGGGPAAVVGRLAAAQAALGHEVRILASNRPDRAEAVECSLRDIPGIADVIRPHLPSVGLKQAFCGFPQDWQEQIREVDLLHLHGVWEPLLLGVARQAQRLDRPYVVAPHGMLDPWSLGQKRLKKQLALMLGYRGMLNRATFLHALNQEERVLLEPLKLRCPMEVIPNGIFLEEFSALPAAGYFREQYPQSGDGRYILFLGRLHFKKGLDLLASAFAQVAARMPDVHLVVAGPDDGAQSPFCDAVQAAGLQSRVHLVGPLYGRDKLSALADAVCFCLPSRQEGFSMAITEAMACGLPVVITDNCHFPEVADAEAGKVVPLEAGPIMRALLDVLSDPAAARRMGEAGRKLVAERFTWPVIAQQSLEAYETAIS